MKNGTLTSLILCVALTGAAGAPLEGFAPPPGEAVAAPFAALAAWKAQPQDNICGLRDLAQVSTPAKIDFERCLEATP